jgi:hypothetical protein
MKEAPSMANDYIIPGEVVSPKRQWTLVAVLYDRGEGQAAAALGRWDGEPVLAMRWNGTDGNTIGNPQSRGLPTWFIVPNEFRLAMLNELTRLAPEKAALAREFFIDAVVLTNTIGNPSDRKAIQDAVLQGIGHRGLTVKIFEPQNSADYLIRIEGANGFRWERAFSGPEQTPDFVQQEVEKATAYPAQTDSPEKVA